jgi:hypothetical protein
MTKETKIAVCEFCFNKFEWSKNFLVATEVCPFCKKTNVCVDLSSLKEETIEKNQENKYEV